MVEFTEVEIKIPSSGHPANFVAYTCWSWRAVPVGKCTISPDAIVYVGPTKEGYSLEDISRMTQYVELRFKPLGFESERKSVDSVLVIGTHEEVLAKLSITK